MIRDIIWLLPILCLLVSIAYCSLRLWVMSKEEIHIYVHRAFNKIGLWKTGMGRWIRLGKYGFYYILSSVLSVVISIIISRIAEPGVIEHISEFVERLSSVELNKLLATFGFAIITIFESLLMYGRDFSKVKREFSKPKRFFFEYFLGGFFPILVWLFCGILVYKDYLFRSVYEWISSPGRVFQLSWGVVSVCIFVAAVFSGIQDMRRD